VHGATTSCTDLRMRQHYLRGLCLRNRERGITLSSWFDGNGNGEQLDIVKVLDSDVGRAVAECVAAGALVSLGTTSDGGALGITVTVDGTWRRDYFRDEDSAGAWLAEAIPAILELRGRSGPTSAPAQRSRRSGKR
jgi:hypothetical protein